MGISHTSSRRRFGGRRVGGGFSCQVGLGIAATSWLGVLVFAGDGNSRRLRFLADRGVSPAKVWLARQLVGLSIVATATLVYALAQAITIWQSDHFPMPSVAMYGLVLLAIYSVSQWVSQLLSMLGMSTVLAPGVGIDCSLLDWVLRTAIAHATVVTDC